MSIGKSVLVSKNLSKSLNNPYLEMFSEANSVKDEFNIKGDVSLSDVVDAVNTIRRYGKIVIPSMPSMHPRNRFTNEQLASYIKQSGNVIEGLYWVEVTFMRKKLKLRLFFSDHKLKVLPSGSVPFVYKRKTLNGISSDYHTIDGVLILNGKIYTKDDIEIVDAKSYGVKIQGRRGIHYMTSDAGAELGFAFDTYGMTKRK